MAKVSNRDCGREDEAEHWFKTAIALGGTEYGLSGLARLASFRGDFARAISILMKGVEEFPGNDVLSNLLTRMLRESGQIEAALENAERSIVRFPDDPVCQTEKARLLALSGNHSDALIVFDRIVEFHPNDEVAQNGRAEVLKEMGELDEALAAFEQAIERFPRNEVARHGLAMTLCAMSRWKEAFDLLPMSRLPRTKDDWIGFHIGGMIALRNGLMEQAEMIFEHGVENTPWKESRPYYELGLSMVRISQRRFEDAERVMPTADQLDMELRTPANVIRIHVWGELGIQNQKITETFESIRKDQRISSDLLLEINSRYVSRTGSQHSDDWLCEKEVLLVLAA